MSQREALSQEAITRAVFELHNALYRQDATNFTALLYNLLFKADPKNHEKIRAGFPAEVLALELWRESPSEVEFFRSFGVLI